MGPQYWYCANAEHLSFVNERWFRLACAKLSLEVVLMRRFAHDNSIVRRFTQPFVNVSYRVAPDLVAAARRRLKAGTQRAVPRELAYMPPSWSTASDHLLAVLRSSRAAAARPAASSSGAERQPC
jgi:hypothetical protein